MLTRVVVYNRLAAYKRASGNPHIETIKSSSNISN
jgi:hypothetical protein